jgi:hypothetical protein
MKTSTILLLAAALFLAGVPVIHALTLNGIIERKEYSMNEPARKPGEKIALNPFTHVEIKAANNISVEIVQSDRPAVEKDEDLDLQFTQRGDTLFIEQRTGAADFHHPYRYLKIEAPRISQADISGIAHSDTTGQGNSREIQSYHLPFEVNIAGFAGDSLELNCGEGGTVGLTANNFKNARFNIGSGSVLNVAKDNSFGSLSVNTAQGGHINLQGPAVEQLKSNIHPESSLTLSGMEIK